MPRPSSGRERMRRSWGCPKAGDLSERRHDLTREQLDLLGRGVDGPEDEGVEAVLGEADKYVGPPGGRTGKRIPRQIADRQPSLRRSAGLADQPLQIEHAPDLPRI